MKQRSWRILLCLAALLLLCGCGRKQTSSVFATVPPELTAEPESTAEPEASEESASTEPSGEADDESEDAFENASDYVEEYVVEIGEDEVFVIN